jgi:hypothetical protein
VFCTPAGFEHDIPRTEHPDSQLWADVGRIQYSATEIRRTLRIGTLDSRLTDDLKRHRPDLEWEFDLW